MVLVTLLAATPAFAQTGDGSLRGYVRDESGAVLPGATVTARSEVLLAPVTSVADRLGYYRLNYLPPGEYLLSCELAGFATYVREGIVLRAGANYSVDATLQISSIEETVTVTADTPMLEIAKPSNVLNVEGDFQREMPIQGRRNWSDFLELTPGVHARPFDDNSGRMVYFGHASELFAHVIQIEGMIANSYQDGQLTHVGMGADMIEDIQVKTGGMDAASPMSTGLVINVVTRRGGNRFSGSVGYAFQPFQWNDDNAPTEGNFAGDPTTQSVNQLDASLGGPIVRDKVWFFGSFRVADLESGISRSPQQLAIFESFNGMPIGKYGKFHYEPFNNTTESLQPYLKITARLNPNHEVSGHYQRDDLSNASNKEWNYEPFFFSKTGGQLFGAKLTSIWGTNTTSQITASFNDKNGERDRDKVPFGGPQIEIHESYVESAGELDGTGLLAQGNSVSSLNEASPYLLMIRGDWTHYKEGWGGSHELQTGIFFMGSKGEGHVQYSNFDDGNGWNWEDHRLIDPDNPSLGTVAFARGRRDVEFVQTIGERDRDIGLYLQDSWKPMPRLTLNLGLRVDFVRRYDRIYRIHPDEHHRARTASGLFLSGHRRRTKRFARQHRSYSRSGQRSRPGDRLPGRRRWIGRSKHRHRSIRSRRRRSMGDRGGPSRVFYQYRSLHGVRLRSHPAFRGRVHCRISKAIPWDDRG